MNDEEAITECLYVKKTNKKKMIYSRKLNKFSQ